MRSKVIHMKTYIESDHELTINAKPFVKWAGGKGQLIEQLEALFPADLAERKDLTYVEPFVGGGAMVFHMLEKYKNITRVVINDFNRDLVTTYVQIKECPDALIPAESAKNSLFWQSSVKIACAIGLLHVFPVHTKSIFFINTQTFP